MSEVETRSEGVPEQRQQLLAGLGLNADLLTPTNYGQLATLEQIMSIQIPDLWPALPSDDDLYAKAEYEAITRAQQANDMGWAKSYLTGEDRLSDYANDVFAGLRSNRIFADSESIRSILLTPRISHFSVSSELPAPAGCSVL